MSTTSITSDNDPLADATYIRANFSYIPRHPKELSIEPGNVFHIFEDGPPERHRRSFWVSRLNTDGSDAGVGAIPNTARSVCVCERERERGDINSHPSGHKSGWMNRDKVSSLTPVLSLVLHVAYYSVAVEGAVYEEVEPYTGMQPVLICGVLANQITALLAEGYPKLFHLCQSGKWTH